MILDRLSSLVSGLGGPKDKAASVAHSLSVLSPAQALAAYRGDWIARKVVDVPAVDMVRAGREWRATRPQIQALEAEERRLRLKQKLLQAVKWSRLFGGAALILGTDDPDPATPLDPATIARGGLRFVHVCGRMELTTGALDRDPLSPTWGEPTWYRIDRVATPNPFQPNPAPIHAGFVDIHPTRVIRLVGAELPDPTCFDGGIGQGWGDSVLQALNDAVIHAGIAAGGIASLVLEAKVDVYSIPNLTQQVGNADYRSRMLERFSLANTAKSLQNALLLDANETYAQKSVNFGALPDILTLYLEIAAAAADIPVTRMLARQSKGASAGLANGGEADLKTYYDRIAADQEMTLRPALEKLDAIMIPSALGSRPPGIDWAFAPLARLSETERSAIRKSDAETAASYAASGLIPKRALAAGVQNAIAEAGAYPGLETALHAIGAPAGGGAWTGVGEAELTGLLAAWQAGAITHATLFDVLQRGALIAPGVAAAAYAEELAASPPPPSQSLQGVLSRPRSASIEP